MWTTKRKICFLSNSVFILTALTILGIHASANSDVQFQYDTEQCLDQLVEYQCIVTGLILTWRVLDTDGTQLALRTYVSSGLDSDIGTIGGGVFTVEQLSTSPLASNISFTVQPSINEYTIICEDGSTMNKDNFTINIKGPPPPPNDFEQKKSCDLVNISWTPPTFPSNCIADYNVTYNFSSISPIDKERSISIFLDELSPDTYCVRVAAVDTANRIGEFSEEQCFEVKEIPPPPPPTNLMWDNNSHTFSWTPPELSSECVSIAYYNVTHNFSSIISHTTTNDNSFILLDELCPGIYCATVATVDTDNKMGSYSEEECFIVQEIPLPPPPAVQTLEYISCNQVKISWTSSSVSTSQCIFVESYSVMHNLNGYNTTITSKNTDITISIDEDTLSREIRYYVSVAAVDTADRIGEYSEEEWFELNDPMCRCSFNVTEDTRSNVLEFTAMWDITSYYLPLVESVLNYNINGMDMESSLSDQTGTFATEVAKGSRDQVNYMANVQVSNCIGNATCSCKNNANVNGGRNTNVPVGPIVGGIVGLICLILLVVIVILLGIVFWKREKLHRNSQVKSNSKSAMTKFDEQSTAPNKITDTVENSEYSLLQRSEGKIANKTPDVVPYSEYSTLQAETILYADLAKATTGKNGSTSAPPKSSEKVDYAAIKHKVEYADVSICQKGQEGHINSRLPQQSVTYSSVTQWRQQNQLVAAASIEH